MFHSDKKRSKMRSCLLFATCWVALASAAPKSLPWHPLVDPSANEEDMIQFSPPLDLEDAWTAFKLKHDKTYSDESEEMNRKEIFAENLKAINENNDLYSKGLSTFTMEINRFADMDDSEFVSLMTGYMPRENLTHSSSLPPDDVGVWPPEYLDWRSKGYVTPVKNQGYCGSSWAFSATGALEGQYARKKGRLVSLSEQQLVDCSRENYGCSGGWQYKAFAYIARNRGIAMEKYYPYEAKVGSCRYRSYTIGGTCSSYREFLYLSEYQLKAQVASIGPISVSIDARQRSFRFYKSGVYHENCCKKDWGQLSLGVLVVGYGKTWSNEYWIVKNSWGTDWGIRGYIYMSRNKNNNCGIATTVSYPVV